jgi:hypothetical protein
MRRLKIFRNSIDAHPMRQTDTECVAYFLIYRKSIFSSKVLFNEARVQYEWLFLFGDAIL